MILIRRFGAERLAALRALRLRCHATTNDVLLALFFRALVAVIDPPREVPLPVGFALDLRRFLPQRSADTICNLAGAVFPAFMPEPEEPLAATVVRVRDTMREIESGYPGLAGAVVTEALFRLGLPVAMMLIRVLMRPGAAANPYFTNLGGLSTGADFGGPSVTDGYLVGPIRFPPGFVLALSSSGKTLTMTAGFCQAGTSRTDVERLLDRIEYEVPQAP